MTNKVYIVRKCLKIVPITIISLMLILDIFNINIPAPMSKETYNITSNSNIKNNKYEDEKVLKEQNTNITNIEQLNKEPIENNHVNYLMWLVGVIISLLGFILMIII